MPTAPHSKDYSTWASPSLGILKEGVAGVTTITSPSSLTPSFCLEPVKIIAAVFGSP